MTTSLTIVAEFPCSVNPEFAERDECSTKQKAGGRPSVFASHADQHAPRPLAVATRDSKFSGARRLHAFGEIAPILTRPRLGCFKGAEGRRRHARYDDREEFVLAEYLIQANWACQVHALAGVWMVAQAAA
jgi:hypothetical protein